MLAELGRRLVGCMHALGLAYYHGFHLGPQAVAFVPECHDRGFEFEVALLDLVN